MQGLQNLGSTCAINSLIQIICRTTSLRDSILNQNNIDETTLTYQLKEILDMMHNKNHSLAPKKFVNYLFKHFQNTFDKGEQLDIGELWIYVIDKIENECGIINNIEYKWEEKDINIEPNNIELSNCFLLFDKCNYIINNMNNKMSSIYIDILHGILLNIIKCNDCNHCIFNFEPFIYIPLDLTNDDIPSISNMFREYLKTQDCNGDWKCDKCNKYTKYIKIIKIWKMPKVLVFIIKRFINIHQKNTKALKINTNLCIKMGSIISDMTKDYNYKCTSLALHYGNLSGGHYCALCNIDNIENKYVLYDDLNMTIIDNDNIKKIFDKNKDAYMIVYSLISKVTIDN